MAPLPELKMFRPLFALPLLGSLHAYAQSSAAEQPIETAGPLAIWIFLILFFGAIGAYVVMTWRGEKKRRDGAKRPGSA